MKTFAETEIFLKTFFLLDFFQTLPTLSSPITDLTYHGRLGEEVLTCYISSSCNAATCKLFVHLKDKKLQHIQFPTYYIACVHWLLQLHSISVYVMMLTCFQCTPSYLSLPNSLKRFLLPSFPTIVTCIINKSIAAVFLLLLLPFLLSFLYILFSSTVL